LAKVGSPAVDNAVDSPLPTDLPFDDFRKKVTDKISRLNKASNASVDSASGSNAQPEPEQALEGGTSPTGSAEKLKLRVADMVRHAEREAEAAEKAQQEQKAAWHREAQQQQAQQHQAQQQQQQQPWP